MASGKLLAGRIGIDPATESGPFDPTQLQHQRRPAPGCSSGTSCAGAGTGSPAVFRGYIKAAGQFDDNAAMGIGL